MQTVSPGVEQRVAAPPLLPPTSGLLQVAKVIPHAVPDDNSFQPSDDHWLAGIRWTPPNNQPGDIFQACNPATALSALRSGLPAGAYYPFAAVAEDTCDSVSFSEDVFRARALESLTAREPGLAEAQLERSTLTGNPRLAENEAGHVFLGSTGNTQATQLALTPKDALAVLDEGIAYWGGGQGMIHAPAYVIAQWVASRSVVIEDLTDTTIPRDPKRVLFSPNGNIIVAGTGYHGVSPDGAVVPDLTVGNHAAMWCYATDLIVVHRDERPSFLPDTMGQALDRQTNTVTWRAFRAYAFAWNRLLHASVKVSTSLAANGGAGAASAVTDSTAPFAEDSSLLLANATRSGTSHATNGYAKFRVFAASDVAGTLSIQQSRDGATWYTTTTPQAVPADSTSATVVESILTLPFARVRYVNGGTNQAVFELDSALIAV